MFRDLHLDSDDVVLELGPGTGSFTREIESFYRQGIRPRYLGIERDPAMHAYLSRRFPELEFANGDIVDVRRICAAHGLPPASAVICGVPLLFIKESTVAEVLIDIRECMASDGVFRAFSYVHCYPTRRASTLRQHLRSVFDGGFDVSSVLRNLPPALVLSGAKNTWIDHEQERTRLLH